MPWAASWPLDRNGLNPTPSHAGPSLLAATPTMLRGTLGIDMAVYWSLPSCHSSKSPNNAILAGFSGSFASFPLSAISGYHDGNLSYLFQHGIPYRRIHRPHEGETD